MVILDFASRDNTLVQAIEEASIRRGEFSSELLMMAEKDLVSHLQEDYVNFYVRLRQSIPMLQLQQEALGL